MKTFKILTLITTFLSVGVYAKSYECTANRKNVKPIIFTIEYIDKEMTLNFDNTFNKEKYIVNYQGWGARDIKAKAESMLVASTTDNARLAVIYWEAGSGFGFTGFGKGFMAIGGKMNPGGSFGKFSTYDVDCKKI